MLTLSTRLSSKEKETICHDCAPLVRYIASRLVDCLPSHVEYQELLNEGFLGLLEALDRYDPSQGNSFKTFAANRIRGAILDSLRRQDWVSRGARRRCRELRALKDSLLGALGRQPKVGDLCRHSGLSRAEVERRRCEELCARVLSIDEPRRGKGDSEECWSEQLPEGGPSLEDAVDLRFLSQSLYRALAELTEREQRILAYYYFDELKLREIGTHLGVSEARVCQLHARCLQKLRQSLTYLPLSQAS